MHISWLGSTGIKLQTKPKNEDINILIDGYKQEKGVFLKTLSPHIALFTQGKENSITLSGDPFVLTTPGEIEIKDVLITAVQGNTVKEVFFRIDTEGISVAHLGKIKEPLNDRQLEVVSGVDILIIPVSGNGLTYNAEQASKAINIIEPRVVIPIAYQSDNEPQADDLSKFLKEIGIEPQITDKKIIIKKRDLPQEETSIYVLTKE